MGKCNVEVTVLNGTGRQMHSRLLFFFPISADFTEFVNVIRYSALCVASLNYPT